MDQDMFQQQNFHEHSNDILSSTKPENSFPSWTFTNNNEPRKISRFRHSKLWGVYSSGLLYGVGCSWLPTFRYNLSDSIFESKTFNILVGMLDPGKCKR